jgi:hypothetical protein
VVLNAHARFCENRSSDSKFVFGGGGTQNVLISLEKESSLKRNKVIVFFFFKWFH